MVKTNPAPLAIATLLGLGFAASLSGAAAQSSSSIPAEQRPAPRAIQCSATLELMARAAPNWSTQAIAQEARIYWRAEAERIAQSTKRNATTEITQEMGLQAEQAVENPNALAEQSTLCLSDVPSYAATRPQGS